MRKFSFLVFYFEDLFTGFHMVEAVLTPPRVHIVQIHHTNKHKRH